MISVPVGTGDICPIWYRTSCDDICLRHMMERILYHICESKYSIRQSRISYRASDISLHLAPLQLLCYNTLKGWWFYEFYKTKTNFIYVNFSSILFDRISFENNNTFDFIIFATLGLHSNKYRFLYCFVWVLFNCFKT